MRKGWKGVNKEINGLGALFQVQNRKRQGRGREETRGGDGGQGKEEGEKEEGERRKARKEEEEARKRATGDERMTTVHERLVEKEEVQEGTKRGPGERRSRRRRRPVDMMESNSGM